MAQKINQSSISLIPFREPQILSHRKSVSLEQVRIAKIDKRQTLLLLRESTYIYCKSHEIGTKIIMPQSWHTLNKQLAQKYQIIDDMVPS